MPFVWIVRLVVVSIRQISHVEDELGEMGSKTER
jgi:hypothetical protein